MKALVTELILFLISKLPGLTDSGSFLIEEVKRLRAENLSLKLELKIMREHEKIEEKFSNMSDDDAIDYAITKNIRPRKTPNS